MTSVLVASGVLACVLLNVAANIAVLRDAALTTIQRRLQVALIWILPLVGAALTFFFRRLTSAVPTVGENDGEGVTDQVLDLASGTQTHHHH